MFDYRGLVREKHLKLYHDDQKLFKDCRIEVDMIAADRFLNLLISSGASHEFELGHHKL